jgi:preprotein translocase subunit SecG
MLTIIIAVLNVVSALSMIVFVLLHSGRGGGLSDMFGGGAASAAAGSTVVERNLDRLTIIAGMVWIFTVVILALRLQ